MTSNDRSILIMSEDNVYNIDVSIGSYDLTYQYGSGPDTYSISPLILLIIINDYATFNDDECIEFNSIPFSSKEYRIRY